MEQVMDVDSCMKVVITPDGGRIGRGDKAVRPAGIAMTWRIPPGR